MKTCSKCEIEKPLADFHKKTGGRFGVGTVCKPCRSDQEKARFEVKRDHILAVNRAAYAANKPARKERNRRYREDNRETLAAHDKGRSYLKNMLVKMAKPEKYRAMSAEYARRRSFNERQATPPWADKQAIHDVYVAAQLVSQLTGVLHHVDHIVPIKSPLVCGLHVHYNLQLLTAEENLAKRNKFEVQTT